MYLSFIFCLLQLHLCNSIPKTRKMSLIDLWPLGLIFNSYLAFKKYFMACLNVYGCIHAMLCTSKSKDNLGRWFFPLPCGSQGFEPKFSCLAVCPHFFFFKWSQYIESVTQYAYVYLRAGSYHGPVCSPGWNGTHCWQFFCHSLPSVGVIGAKHHTILFWGFNCRTPIHAG